MRIYGVVVLYNPSPEIVCNLDSYVRSLERLFVIDNSDHPNKIFKNELQQFANKIEYISLGSNQGIATALNKGFELARLCGAEWVLTMDQDSQFKANAFNILLDNLKSIPLEEIDSVGVLSCSHFVEGYENEASYVDLKEVDFVMTSGNLVNLDAFNRVAGFRDDFFIDEVDIDFCRRLKEKSFKVLVANKAVMKHYLGDTRKHKIFSFYFMCSHHNYVRRYYITRNRFYMAKLYPDLHWEYLLRNVVALLKIIVFEEDKLRKLRAFITGIVDSFEGTYGKKTFKY